MGIGTDIFRLGSKISSLFSFKRFNFGFYHTLSLKARKEYLSENRNKLSKKDYEIESDRLYKEYQREVRRLNDREILLNSNIEHKFVVCEDGSWDIIGNVKTPKSYPPCLLPGISSGKKSAIDMKWDWEVQEELKKKQVLTPSQRRYLDMEEAQKNLQNPGFQNSLKYIEEQKITDYSWGFKTKDVTGTLAQWGELKKQELEKEKRIEEMNEGCILCITDKGAYCSPLIEYCSPIEEDKTFRYRMIINRLSKVNNEDEWKEVVMEMFPFMDKDKITYDGDIETYFPLDFRKTNYYSKFAAKWFFVKNTSQDPVMIYLRTPLPSGKTFIVVKPGGIISMLYGGPLDNPEIKEHLRLPSDHEYMIQYKNKTHPIIK